MDVKGRSLGNKRLWLCAQGHALGVIRTEKVRDTERFKLRATMLYLFRAAVDVKSANVPERVIIAGRVRATVGMRWTCSICGAQREWHEFKNLYVVTVEDVR